MRSGEDAMRSVARNVIESTQWARVAVRSRRPPQYPVRIESVPPTAVLSSEEEVRAALREVRRLRLPRHPDPPKNWDALGAVGAVLQRTTRGAHVLDAGAAQYSVPLPWLRILGYRNLLGINIDLKRPRRRGLIAYRPGDATSTGLPSGSIDAALCLSVIEHGVPLERFLPEMARIVKPGGLLVVSTDYDQEPPDTRGLSAYGVPVKVFGQADIEQLTHDAADHGLSLVGDLALRHSARPVHWKRLGLRYTFILMTFERR